MAVVVYENDSRLNWINAGWALATNYNVHDALEHNGTSYRCIVAHTSASTDEPGVGANEATYWAVVAAKGAGGSAGSDGVISEVQDEGVALTDRATMDFTGAGVTVTDTGSKYQVSVPGGGGSFSGAKARKNTQQSIPNAAWTSLTLQSEDFDTDAYHDAATNTSRMTVPAGKAGKYTVHGTVGFDGSTTGFRFLRIIKNGVTEQAIVNQTPASNGDSALAVSTVVDLAVGDYVEIQGWQNSGGALNTNIDNNRTTLAVALLGA